jgi:hypothetical protein
MTEPEGIGILKSLWGCVSGNRWGIRSIKGLTLKPRKGSESDFFTFESEMELMTQSPGSMNVHELFASFGSTDFLMKQSILPVVAWTKGESFIRCIGTAFVISCTGYVMTACVLLDPKDRDYGTVVREGNTLKFMDDLNMGAFIPFDPAYGRKGFGFFRSNKAGIGENGKIVRSFMRKRGSST